MKKVILVGILTIGALFSKAQMISVTGGNLWLHGNDKGFLEAEIMQNINKKLSLHVSGTKVMGGYDMAMVGARYALDEKLFGVTFSTCFMEKHNAKAMFGFDIALPKDMRLAYSQSTDSELFQVGLKIPVLELNQKSHK